MREEGVCYIQLVYAPYSALLPVFESTSLLGAGERTKGTKEMGLPKLLVVLGAEGGIVSEGVAQVFDDVGNPPSHCGV